MAEGIQSNPHLLLRPSLSISTQLDTGMAAASGFLLVPSIDRQRRGKWKWRSLGVVLALAAIDGRTSCNRRRETLISSDASPVFIAGLHRGLNRNLRRGTSDVNPQVSSLDGWIDGRTDVTGEGGAVAGFDDTASKVRVQRRTGDGDAEDERRCRLSEMIPKYHLNPWICSDASRASACSLPQCWDLLRTHIFPRTRELPQFPISSKPLFLSKNRLRNPSKPVLKQNKKLCTYAQKKKFAHMQRRLGIKESEVNQKPMKVHKHTGEQGPLVGDVDVKKKENREWSIEVQSKTQENQRNQDYLWAVEQKLEIEGLPVS
ncbi:hypothetical protein LXL04_010207 [Taraxacum kok-saghyz]